jgi:hypothetical protein
MLTCDVAGLNPLRKFFASQTPDGSNPKNYLLPLGSYRGAQYDLITTSRESSNFC